jgi:CheY-like chemotaxis protein
LRHAGEVGTEIPLTGASETVVIPDREVLAIDHACMVPTLPSNPCAQCTKPLPKTPRDGKIRHRSTGGSGDGRRATRRMIHAARVGDTHPAMAAVGFSGWVPAGRRWEMRKCAALIVEDDESVQRLLQVVLQKHCTSVDLAADGEAAIAMVRDGSYDVVLLDLMLPKVNGLAVSEAIQALPARPKVIVLSAISRYFTDRFPEDTLVLQKPFDIDRIEDALRNLVAD